MTFIVLADSLEETLGVGTREAGKGADNVSDSGKHSHVDGQHAGKVSSGSEAGSPRVFRRVGLDDHHPRVNAAGHFLQIPLGHLPVRGVEELL